MSQDEPSSAAPGDEKSSEFAHHSIEIDVAHVRSPLAKDSSTLKLLLAILRRHPAIQRRSPAQAARWKPSPRRRRSILPPWILGHLTFYRLHLAYFVTVAAIASVCLWLFPKNKNARRLSFIDCVYNAVSSVCTTGLISVRVSSFSTPDNLLIMLLMILGSPIFTSLLPLYIRQFEFRRNIHEIEHYLGHCQCGNALESDVESEVVSEVPVPEVAEPDLGQRRRSSSSSAAKNSIGGGGGGDEESKLRDALAAMHLEYSAIVALNWVVSIYLAAWLLLGFLVLEVLLQCSARDSAILAHNGVHHLFFSIFASISTLTNSGILPLDDNMVPLRHNSGILLWLSLLILVGNTLFAPCLRAVIWCLKRLSATAKRRSTYDYLLTNPRRCFTHLFPRNQTLWLVVTVMGFNAFESAFFYILSWRSKSLDGLTTPQKLVNGIFQSITTRSAGENVVSIAGLSPSMLVLYIAMMYIAVYPVYLSRQNSQAQDETVEEVKKKKKDGKKTNKKKKNKKDDKSDFSIASQSKRLMATDTAYLFISIFVLCIIENRRINDDPLNFSIFNIIFEVISAYGNVGLSLGYSCSLLQKLTSFSSDTTCEDVPYSFSGTWSVSGKLLMIVIMFLGRHRGLPDNMDSALRIPKSFFTTNKVDDDKMHHFDQQEPPPNQVMEIHPELLIELPALEQQLSSTVEIDELYHRQPEQQEPSCKRDNQEQEPQQQQV